MQNIRDSKFEAGDSVKSNSLVYASLKRYKMPDEKQIRLYRVKCIQ